VGAGRGALLPHPAQGKAVQVDPIKPTLKVPGAERLKLRYDEPLSICAFSSNWRRYNKFLMPIVVAGCCNLKPALNPPGFTNSASKVKYDEMLLRFVFNLSLRHYTVAVEKIIQNSLGAVGAPPMSLASITALEKALEKDFVAAGGRGLHSSTSLLNLSRFCHRKQQSIPTHGT
jgi:hypothetical protein